LLVWLVTCVTAFTGLAFSLLSQRSFDTITSEVIPHMSEVDQLQAAAAAFDNEFSEIDMSLRDGDLAHAEEGAAEAAHFANAVKASLTRLDAMSGEHGDPIFIAAERRLAQAWQSTFTDSAALVRGYDQEFGTSLAAAMGVSSTGRSIAGTTTVRVLDQRREDLMLEADSLGRLHSSAVNAAISESAARLRRELLVELAVVIASLLFSAATAVGISRSIRGPLAHATEHAQAVRDGDYSMQLEEPGLAEIASLMHALELMKSSLVSRISQLERVTSALARAASQTSESAEMLVETSMTMSNADTTRAEAVDRIRTAAGSLARQSGALKALTVEAKCVLDAHEPDGSPKVSGDAT
jgi:methyl-accepting chemotaxis protein